MPNLNAADLLVQFTANQSGDNDLGNPIFAPSLKKAISYSNGTAAGQADILFSDERTVGAGANDDLDLYGALTSAYGATLNMAEIVAVIIAADSTNAGLLNVGGGTNPWFGMFLATGNGVKLMPNGVFVNAAYDASGLGAVTAATADILRVSNPGGAACKYKIVILARSA